MSDVSRRVSLASDAIQVQWTPERAVAVEAAAWRKRHRVKKLRGAGTAIAVAMVCVLGMWSFASRNHVALASQHSNAIALDDGSLITPLSADTRFEISQPSRGLAIVRLVRGSATFDVVHREHRMFRVEAGSVAVQVLGTSFSVEQNGARVRIRVSEGRVRAMSPERSVDLSAGEIAELQSDVRRSAPMVAGVAERPSENQPEAAIDPPVRTPCATPGVTARETVADTRSSPNETNLAQHARTSRRAGSGAVRGGETAEAASATPVPDEVTELFLEADHARSDRRFADAVIAFRTILDRHGDSPRASLAAFELGRVLLEDVGQWREAADAFARVERLDRESTLVEDALARQVEAYVQGGDIPTARALAESYVGRFPSGHRTTIVRRLGGLDR